MYAQCKSCHVVCLVNPLCLIPLQLMEFLRSKHPTMAQVLEVVLGDIGTLTRPCLFINRLCMCESVCARACVCVCTCVCVCVFVCVCLCARAALQCCIGLSVHGSEILQSTASLQCCRHAKTNLLKCNRLHQTPV